MRGMIITSDNTVKGETIMKTKHIVGTLAILVAAFAGGYYFTNNTTTTTQASTAETNTADTTAPTTTVKAAVDDTPQAADEATAPTVNVPAAEGVETEVKTNNVEATEDATNE